MIKVKLNKPIFLLKKVKANLSSNHFWRKSCVAGLWEDDLCLLTKSRVILPYFPPSSLAL